MPTYEYECGKCHEHFERTHKISDPPVKECPKPKCKGEVKRLIAGASTFVLKGGGWYKDGY